MNCPPTCTCRGKLPAPTPLEALKSGPVGKGLLVMGVIFALVIFGA